MGESRLDWLSRVDDDERAAYLATCDGDELALILERDWTVVRRPEQGEPDGEWLAWVICTGRGWGKTRTGAEWSIERARTLAAKMGHGVRWALVGETFADARDTMVEGESGLLSSLAPSELVNGSVDDSWNRSLGELTLANGTRYKLFSSEKPRRLRGPQHHGLWADEPGTFRDAKDGLGEDTTMAMALFGLRLDPDPRACVTGTPRNVRLIRELLDDPRMIVTTGSTYENLHNLAPSYRQRVVERYEGTRLGRQELHAELLADTGETFQRGWFDFVEQAPTGPKVSRVRYWDLAATEPSEMNPDPDWTCGALVSIDNGQRPARYCIEHVARFRLQPGKVEDRIIELAREDGLRRVGIEQEPGSAGKSQVAHYKRQVSGISRVEGHRPTGPKETRAEIVAAAAEQGRVSIVRGSWNLGLLDELEEFPNGNHDDQVDALSGAWDLLQRSTGGLTTSSAVGTSVAGLARPGR